MGLKKLNYYIEWLKMDKKLGHLKKKNFTVFMYKSKNVAQSQLTFAPLHGGETVTFKNSGHLSHVMCPASHIIWHVSNVSCVFCFYKVKKPVI